mmetsp:Transcript_5067/g.8697  ORF Transcript_5067/g.8697 Transcript_5067/m.8697 type:complete len:100 (+) Transcript_5067:1340-1639(+)
MKILMINKIADTADTQEEEENHKSLSLLLECSLTVATLMCYCNAAGARNDFDRCRSTAYHGESYRISNFNLVWMGKEAPICPNQPHHVPPFINGSPFLL